MRGESSKSGTSISAINSSARSSDSSNIEGGGMLLIVTASVVAQRRSERAEQEPSAGTTCWATLLAPRVKRLVLGDHFLPTSVTGHHEVGEKCMRAPLRAGVTIRFHAAMKRVISASKSIIVRSYRFTNTIIFTTRDSSD